MANDLIQLYDTPFGSHLEKKCKTDENPDEHAIRLSFFLLQMTTGSHCFNFLFTLLFLVTFRPTFFVLPFVR